VLPYSRKKLHWEIDCDDYVLKRTNSIWQRGYLVDGLDVQLKKIVTPKNMRPPFGWDKNWHAQPIPSQTYGKTLWEIKTN
jgi:hypothetical protein